jgi:hypothetical protein
MKNRSQVEIYNLYMPNAEQEYKPLNHIAMAEENQENRISMAISFRRFEPSSRTQAAPSRPVRLDKGNGP